MALSAGTRIGAYEVLGSLGEGGMGEVYRARDTKLGREVAIKILPDAFADDPERLARFDREARTLAALNHPHIATIHGLEDRALVMELVEGEDLSQRIRRGAIPIEESVGIARQIAEALGAAHEQGIVHRDLKPANVKVRSDGTVKVLDFGLAKAVDGAGRGGRAGQAGATGSDEVLNSPTITTPAMTMHGMILGTAAYMAPEQAKGAAVDKRADIWAFGAVFYEMLTARRAFEGDDASETLAAILKIDPDWNRLPSDTPPQVRLLIQRCLTRDRRARISDMGVVRFLLTESLAIASSAVGVRRRLPVVAAIIAGLLVGATATALVFTLQLSPPARSAQVVHFTLTPQPPHALATVQAGGADRNVVLDRQGRFVVYRGGAGMMSELMVRDLHSLEERVIPGSLGARGPFLSPDGLHVGFSVGGQLRRVPLAGGPAAVITQSGVSRGGTWGSDDRIVFANAEGDTGLRIVSAAGGTAETLTVPDRTNGEADHVFPFMLPGNRAVLFTIQRGRSENASGIPNVVAILDLETRKWKPLITGATRAEYVAPGHLIYATGSSIMAVGFNPNTLAISGQPTLLIESASADFTLADTGTLAFVPVSAYQGVVAVERTLVWVDRSGKEEAIAAPARGYQMARLSPDGTRIAVQVSDGQSDLFVWDIARQALTRITAGASDEQSPLWTPDGARLVWSSNIESNPNLFWQAADGSGSAERMTLAAVAQFPTSISADGKTVVFHEFTGSGSRLRRFALPAFGGAKPTQASAEPLLEARGLFGGELSPDGRWLAYHSSESGQPEVYVRPFPNTDSGRWQVSNNGGTRAGWSRDGRELFYLDGEGLLTVAGVQVDAQTLKLTAPKKLLNARYLPGSTVLGLDLRGYDVSPDGKRFVMIKDTAPETTAAAPLGSISVILNWTEQLRARVPLR